MVKFNTMKGNSIGTRNDMLLAYLSQTPHVLRHPADLHRFVTHRSPAALTASDTVQRQGGLPDVVQEVPHLVGVLHRKSRSALSGCNTQLRHIFHSCTSVVLMTDQRDLQSLVKGYWPQLAVVVLRKHQLTLSLSHCNNDNLQIVAVLDLWQKGHKCSMTDLWHSNAKCSVLLMASKVQQQQQAGLVYNSEAATVASNYLNPRCRDVNRLAVRHKVGTCGIAQLALINWCSLHTLDLVESKLEPVDMIFFMKASLLQLQILDLSCNNLRSEGIEVLLSAYLPKLCSLNLRQTQLDAAAARQLGKGDWPNLWLLYLCDNCLDDMAMTHIADGLWPELVELKLEGNPIGALGFQRLMKGRWPKLDSLTVGSTMLSPATLALVDISVMPCLQAEKGELIKIPREFANHDPGQSLIWPSLEQIACLVV